MASIRFLDDTQRQQPAPPTPMAPPVTKPPAQAPSAEQGWQTVGQPNPLGGNFNALHAVANSVAGHSAAQDPGDYAAPTPPMASHIPATNIPPATPPQTPAAPPSQPQQGMGTYSWHNTPAGQSYINAFVSTYKQAFRRDPTPQELWQHFLVYDRMPSPQFFAEILQNLRNSAAQQQQSQGGAPTGGGGGGSAWAQGSGQSFRDWFLNLARGASTYDQNFLLGLEGLLGQSGSRLTGANAQGERTKIWDPELRDWVRVGFGEGTPVWIPQGWGESGPQASGGGGYPSSYSDEATKALEKYLKERVARLQQPAYTGAEWETFRTAALDPIENDRQAARQRALNNIGARGLDPTSGIAQQLLNDTDAGFDQSRAKTQNQLAYNRISEERSREQEVQQLLTLLYDLPNQSLQQALAVLGMSPSPSNLSSQWMQYWNQQQANSLPWWQALGSLLPRLNF